MTRADAILFLRWALPRAVLFLGTIYICAMWLHMLTGEAG